VFASRTLRRQLLTINGQKLSSLLPSKTINLTMDARNTIHRPPGDVRPLHTSIW
jgi:hypothetical protein